MEIFPFNMFQTLMTANLFFRKIPWFPLVDLPHPAEVDASGSKAFMSRSIVRQLVGGIITNLGSPAWSTNRISYWTCPFIVDLPKKWWCFMFFSIVILVPRRSFQFSPGCLWSWGKNTETKRQCSTGNMMFNLSFYLPKASSLVSNGWFQFAKTREPSLCTM